MYYVYILRSKQVDFYYFGSTEDLKRRVEEHNLGKVVSTKNKKPYKLIWYCCFCEKQKALDFEKYLKTGSGGAFANKRFK